MEQEEKITISLEEYESLLEQVRWLECLELAGVDNWEGYDEAVSMFQEEQE